MKSWRDGDTMPYWMHMLRVCAYFGPAFTSEILVPAGMGGVDLVADVERDPQGTATDLIAAAHDILDRLRDGRFCHVDRAETAPVLLELSRQIEAQARALGAEIRHGRLVGSSLPPLVRGGPQSLPRTVSDCIPP